jgi:hypothetical protein
MEILIVLSLVLLVGTFSTFYIRKAIDMRRFETNCKNLQTEIGSCREMALVHQTDVQLVIRQDIGKPKVLLEILCSGSDQKGPLIFTKRSSSFEPLWISSLEHQETLTCTFYSSGFVETNSENIRISDGKREVSIPLSFQVSKGEKPVHPFALKKGRENL